MNPSPTLSKEQFHILIARDHSALAHYKVNYANRTLPTCSFKVPWPIDRIVIADYPRRADILEVSEISPDQKIVKVSVTPLSKATQKGKLINEKINILWIWKVLLLTHQTICGFALESSSKLKTVCSLEKNDKRSRLFTYLCTSFRWLYIKAIFICQPFESRRDMGSQYERPLQGNQCL